MGLNDKKLLRYFMTSKGSNLHRILLTKVQRSIFNFRFSPNTDTQTHTNTRTCNYHCILLEPENVIIDNTLIV